MFQLGEFVTYPLALADSADSTFEHNSKNDRPFRLDTTHDDIPSIGAIAFLAASQIVVCGFG